MPVSLVEGCIAVMCQTFSVEVKLQVFTIQTHFYVKGKTILCEGQRKVTVVVLSLLEVLKHLLIKYGVNFSNFGNYCNF